VKPWYVHINAPHSKAFKLVSLVNLPESVRLQGKQQVFLQAKSEPPAAIQAKQHAFARALLQQLHCAAVAELTAMLKTIRASNMSTTEVLVLVLVCILLLSIAFLVRLLLALVLS
jgi:hypothetical protein